MAFFVCGWNVLEGSDTRVERDIVVADAKAFGDLGRKRPRCRPRCRPRRRPGLHRVKRAPSSTRLMTAGPHDGVILVSSRILGARRPVFFTQGAFPVLTSVTYVKTFG